jgi:hypothetical protein
MNSRVLYLLLNALCFAAGGYVISVLILDLIDIFSNKADHSFNVIISLLISVVIFSEKLKVTEKTKKRK